MRVFVPLDSLIAILTELAPASAPIALRLDATQSGTELPIIAGEGALWVPLLCGDIRVGRLGLRAPLPARPGIDSLVTLIASAARARQQSPEILAEGDLLESLRRAPLGPPLVGLLRGRGRGADPAGFVVESMEFAANPGFLAAALHKCNRISWSKCPEVEGIESYALGNNTPSLTAFDAKYALDEWDREPEHPIFKELLGSYVLRARGRIRVGTAVRWRVLLSPSVELLGAGEEPALQLARRTSGWGAVNSRSEPSFGRSLSHLLEKQAPAWLCGADSLSLHPIPFAGSRLKPSLAEWALEASARIALIVGGKAPSTLGPVAIESDLLRNAMAANQRQHVIAQDVLHNLRDLPGLIEAVIGDYEDGDHDRVREKLDRLMNHAFTLKRTCVLLNAGLAEPEPVDCTRIHTAIRMAARGALARARGKIGPRFAVDVVWFDPPIDQEAEPSGDGMRGRFLNSDPGSLLLELLENLLCNALVAAESCGRPPVKIELQDDGVAIHNYCHEADSKTVEEAFNGGQALGKGVRTCLAAAKMLGCTLEADRDGSSSRLTVRVVCKDTVQ